MYGGMPSIGSPGNDINPLSYENDSEKGVHGGVLGTV